MIRRTSVKADAVRVIEDERIETACLQAEDVPIPALIESRYQCRKIWRAGLARLRKADILFGAVVRGIPSETVIADDLSLERLDDQQIDLQGGAVCLERKYFRIRICCPKTSSIDLSV